MDESPRIALIGLGYWGKKILSSLLELDPGCLIRVCDEKQEILDHLKERFPRIECSTDVREVLEDERVDAVVVALPPSLHYEIGMAVLAANKHLFLEKPMVQELAHARDVMRAAGGRHRVLFVGLTYRYHVAVDRIAELIREGALGRVSNFYSWRTNLNLRTKHANVVWMLAPHDISIFQHWAGCSPQSVRVQPERAAKIGFEQDSFVDMFFKGDLVGHVHFSWLVPGKKRRLVAVGEDRVLVYDEMAAPDALFLYPNRFSSWPADLDEAGSLVESLADDPEVIDVQKDYEPPLVRECRHFLDCLQGRAQPLTNGEMGMEVLRVIQAMVRSGREGGREVSVKEIEG